jgi:hypothetical protein
MSQTCKRESDGSCGNESNYVVCIEHRYAGIDLQKAEFILGPSITGEKTYQTETLFAILIQDDIQPFEI